MRLRNGNHGGGGREQREHLRRHLFGADRVHAAEVDRALAQKTGTALDMVPDDEMAITERAGEARLGRSENRDHRHTEERREVHRARVICQKKPALAKFGDQVIERGLADAIHAILSEFTRDDLTCRCISCGAEEVPLDGLPGRDRLGNLGEALGQPALGRPVFRAGAETELYGPSERHRSRSRQLRGSDEFRSSS